MTINPWRGEVEIMLDGAPYILRPTFERLSHIEQKLGVGLLALARKIAEGTITLAELAIIITECLQTKPRNADIAELVVESGLSSSMQSVTAMFALVFGGFDAVCKP